MARDPSVTLIKIDADLLHYGREVEGLRIELLRWPRDHPQRSIIRLKVSAAENVLKALLLLKLRLTGE